MANDVTSGSVCRLVSMYDDPAYFQLLPKHQTLWLKLAMMTVIGENCAWLSPSHPPSNVPSGHTLRIGGRGCRCVGRNAYGSCPFKGSW